MVKIPKKKPFTDFFFLADFLITNFMFSFILNFYFKCLIVHRKRINMNRELESAERIQFYLMNECHVQGRLKTKLGLTWNKKTRISETVKTVSKKRVAGKRGIYVSWKCVWLWNDMKKSKISNRRKKESCQENNKNLFSIFVFAFLTVSSS